MTFTSPPRDWTDGETVNEAMFDTHIRDQFRYLKGMDGTVTTEDSLVIDQGAADDEALGLKSSDVAHAMTTYAETDTYLDALKYHATQGGAGVRGLSSGTVGLAIQGFGVTDDTAKTTAATGYIMANAYKRNGAGPGVIDPGADANLFCITQASTTRFIFDAEGSAHADVEWVAFDDYDDVALLSDLERALVAQRDAVKRGFVEFLKYNRADLERAKIVRFDEDHPGHAMVDMTRLSMLLVGAIKQLSTRIGAIEAALLPSGT